MRKTSVYLPDALKRRLGALAERTGVSEAELIRESIERRLAGSERPVRADAPVPGRLVGVGVGPGPSDLVTVRALDALRRADRVVAPCTSLDAVGRAEAIVRDAAPDVVVERMVFVMARDHDARAAALAEVCDRVAAHLAAGEEVAFITLGDPNLYSTVSSVIAGVRARRPETEIATVAGITAFQALAMEGPAMLADEQQSLVLVPASAPAEIIEAELARSDRSVVLYKAGGRIAALADALESADRLDGAVMGELIGMPGERVASVAELRDRPASYLSAVISPAPDGAGPVVGPVEVAEREVAEREVAGR
ncbi:MAG: precorrin-2 C(20)-methyltransferase [Actinomycetota bacterium]